MHCEFRNFNGCGAFLFCCWMQTNYGDIEFGFFPGVAPKTVDHIFKLVRLGCFNTNHFFRVSGWELRKQVVDVML